MKKALILFAHGARDPEWALPLRRVQAMVRSQLAAAGRDEPVELAFLEFMSPSLAEVTEQLAAQSVTDVTVIPMFMAQGGHLKRDLPLMLDKLAQDFPALRFKLAAAVGEHEAVLQAMAQVALLGLGA